MGNGIFQEYLIDNVATADNFVTFKKVIEQSIIFHSDTSTNTLGLIMGRLRIRFITP
jgi:hypothetical protein